MSSPGSIDFGMVNDADVIDLLKGLLDSEPSKRLGYRSIDEIKSHPFFKDAERPRADIEVNFIQTRILNMFKALIEEDEYTLNSKQSHIERDATENF